MAISDKEAFRILDLPLGKSLYKDDVKYNNLSGQSMRLCHAITIY